MTAIMPSIIRSPSPLFNISMIVHSYEISKILLCQEEQLTLKYYPLNDKLISPYTNVCNTSYTSITLQTVPQRLSHSVNFNGKIQKRKTKKRTRSSSKHHSIGSRSRISAASHYHRYYRAPRRRFPILPQAPRTSPENREREREERRKKN